MQNETGGTVRVEGVIRFKYQVQSEDINAFSVEEMISRIDGDGIGWFIDMNLGEPCTSIDPTAENSPTVPVAFSDKEEAYEIDQIITVVEAYEIVGEDEKGLIKADITVEDWEASLNWAKSRRPSRNK